mgnify:CR=1 FL=1
MPTKAYGDALEACKGHHREHKTFSGKFLRPHAPFIKEIVDRLGCKTILDYGAGKGRQYEWVNPETGLTMEQHWGVEVRKYDPAWPPYAEEPSGKFDLVICTHTLRCIPLTDLPVIIDRLYSLSGRALYIVERIGRPKKGLFQSDAFPQWTPKQWAAAVGGRPGVETHLICRERGPEGMHLHRFKL